jgi:hypothetical protein
MNSLIVLRGDQLPDDFAPGPMDAEDCLPESQWYPAYRRPDGGLYDRLTIDELVKIRSMAYDFTLGALPGQPHGAFGAGSLHLVQGSSGTGKSNLVLQMLRAQKDFEPFFGRESYGKDYLVLWQDRNEVELELQLDSMGLTKSDVPHHVATGEEMDSHPHTVIHNLLCQIEKKRRAGQVAVNEERDAHNEAYRLTGEVRTPTKFVTTRMPKVLFVEGLDLWLPDIKDLKQVATIARAVRDLATEWKIAIIGSVGAPKMKPREKYEQPRDRAIGSSAWARVSSNIVDITIDEETQVRHVQLLTRTGPAQHLEMVFEGGLLVPKEPAIPIVSTPVAPVVPSLREIKAQFNCRTEKAQAIRQQLLEQAGTR